jgi:hypothetical protein
MRIDGIYTEVNNIEGINIFREDMLDEYDDIFYYLSHHLEKTEMEMVIRLCSLERQLTLTEEI